MSAGSWWTTSCWCRAARWRGRPAASCADRRPRCRTSVGISGVPTLSEKRRDLLDKLKAIQAKRAEFEAGTASPGSTVIEKVLGPCETVIGGRPTLMFGSNNYLGLTLHPAVVKAACDAITEFGSGTTGSRTANGTLALHERL